MKTSFRDRIAHAASQHRIAVSIAATIALIGLPFVLNNAYYLRIATLVGMYVLLVSGLNIIIGFAGMFSLGHAAFYGIGAYTSAMLTVMAGWSFWIALPMAGIVAALFGSLIGLVTLRLRKVFLAFTTLGFGEIIRILILNWRSFTRGPLGIAGVPVPELFGWRFTGVGYYYLILVLATVTVSLIYF
ncbi:MAG TPA: branched-chain amino acid ABC transporter permease, partial [Alkalispirochaeta sp.]|nr:branched-chain amino acid ABC transporter permease [Alkalispirochaeta sp.]